MKPLDERWKRLYITVKLLLRFIALLVGLSQESAMDQESMHIVGFAAWY